MVDDISYSYERSLWGAIEVIRIKFDQGQNEIKDLIIWFEDRVEWEELALKRLQRLSRPVSYDPEGHLGKALHSLRNISAQQTANHATVLKKIREELLVPLREFGKDHLKTGTELQIDSQTYEKEIGKLVADINKYKARYYKAAKHQENCIISLQKASTGRLSSLRSTKIQKMKANYELALRATEESEKIYKESIALHQSLSSKYISETKKIYQQYQILEETRIETLCKILNRFNEIETHFIQYYTNSTNELDKKLVNVDINVEIRDWVQSRLTGKTPDSVAIQFESYESYRNGLPKKKKKAPASRPRAGTEYQPSSAPSPHNPKPRHNLSDFNSVLTNSMVEFPSFPDNNGGNLHSHSARTSAADFFEISSQTNGHAKGRKASNKEFRRSLAFPRSLITLSPTKQEKQKYRRSAGFIDSPLGPQSFADYTETPEETSSGDVTELSQDTNEDHSEILRSPKQVNLPKVKVVHNYTASAPDEMSIRVGDLIEVHNADHEGWWRGVSLNTGEDGNFPAPFVQLVEGSIETAKTKVIEQKCLALYNFVGEAPGELSVTVGETLYFEAELQGWYKGRNEKGEIGLFPVSYVRIV